MVSGWKISKNIIRRNVFNCIPFIQHCTQVYTQISELSLTNIGDYTINKAVHKEMPNSQGFIYYSALFNCCQQRAYEDAENVKTGRSWSQEECFLKYRISIFFSLHDDVGPIV